MTQPSHRQVPSDFLEATIRRFYNCFSWHFWSFIWYEAKEKMLYGKIWCFPSKKNSFSLFSLPLLFLFPSYRGFTKFPNETKTSLSFFLPSSPLTFVKECLPKDLKVLMHSVDLMFQTLTVPSDDALKTRTHHKTKLLDASFLFTLDA